MLFRDHYSRVVAARDGNKLVNFELSTPQFQTDLLRIILLHVGYELAFTPASFSWALLHLIHCWKDGWCRLKDFSEVTTCFESSVLQCIFRTPLLRGIIVEYGSKLQHYELYCYKHHTVLIFYELYEKMIDNRSHVLPTGFTVESQSSMWIHYPNVAPLTP